MTRSKLPGKPQTTAPADPDDQAGGVSRRMLLSRLAKLGIAATALAAGGVELVSYRDEAHSATKTAAGAKAKHAWCMVVDLRYCDGCESCTLACQERHQLTKDQTWLKVYTMTDAEGVTLVDQNVCIGCRACMAACPYEARYFNWSDPPQAKRLPMPPTPEFPVPQAKGTVGKCVLCVDRLTHGELPGCVAGCPMGVIYVGDLVTDVAVNGLGTTVRLSQFLKDNDAVRFKEELGTSPRVYYILGHGQSI